MSEGESSRDYVAETKTVLQKLGHVVEECGELSAAAGKTIRWGLDSWNPELPPEQRETNRDWLLREMRDLRRAMDRLEKSIVLKRENT